MLKALALSGAAVSLPNLLAACQAATSAGPSLVPGASGNPAVSTAPSAATSVEKVVWSVNQSIRTLDPIFGNNVVSLLGSLGHESLLEYTFEGRLIPKLAAEWSQPDPLTYLFELRPGVTFWDGTPLTAEDVVFSIERYIDPENGSGWASFWNALDTVEESGDGQVTMKLKYPDAAFKYWCAFGGSRILSKKFLTEHPEDYGTTAELVMGTGPYRYTRFVPEQTVVAVRNTDYWGEPARVGEIEVKTIVDEATRLLAFQSGEIDGGFYIPANQTAQWEAAGARTEFAPAMAVTFFTMNTTLAPWSDIHVRRAVAHSIDRQGLVDSILSGHGQAAPAMVAPAQWVDLLSPAEVADFYSSLGWEFDLEKARQELAASSVPEGFKAEITYADSQQAQGAVALHLSQNLAQIGIELEVRELPAIDQFSDAFLKHDKGIYILQWTGVSPDPSELPGLMFHSQYAREGAFNFTYYRNPTMDALLEEQFAASDPSMRTEILRDVLTLANEDAFQVPVFYEDFGMGIASDLTFDGLSAWIRYQSWPDRFGSA
jgi:peptide/nickel transport system substrate-binding protein